MVSHTTDDSPVVGTSSLPDTLPIETVKESQCEAIRQIIEIPNPSRDRFRREYSEALATFTDTTLFVLKPSCLSPVTMAALGWKVVRNDLLECRGCKRQISMPLPAMLSNNVRKTLSAKYYKQLATSHQDTCPFKSEAKAFIENSETEATALPPPLAWVWDPIEVELAEHTAPMEILRDLAKAISDTETVESSDLNILLDEKKKCSDITEETLNSLVARLGGTVDSKALLLALLGWRKETKPEGTKLVCHLCKATYRAMALGRDSSTSSSGTADSTSSPPERKKRRFLYPRPNPWSCHRHYCPHANGLVRPDGSQSLVPLHKAILERVMKGEQAVVTQNTVPTTADDIRNLLLQGLRKTE